MREEEFIPIQQIIEEYDERYAWSTTITNMKLIIA
jgi:hypothetical protein